MAWALGLIIAFVAGFALQRGGICAVRAVREAALDGRWHRFAAFLECAAWALIGLLLADGLGLQALSAWPQHEGLLLAAAGGAVFGAGALINGACAFGSAARLAAGETSFLALIPGFVVGALAVQRSMGPPAMQPGAAPSGVVLSAIIAALALFALWRLWTARRATPNLAAATAVLTAPHWPPALAMAVIAACNVALLLLIAAWPYTTLLLDLAFERGMDELIRGGVALTLLAGAGFGAVVAGRFALRGGSLRAVLARFTGGLLMGAGAAMIPGGNDALVLQGLPLLQPSAFAAYAAMLFVIAAGFLIQRALAPAL